VPLVTVVTPVYNTVEYISECIESVLAQTYSHWEYVIYDNCSTDGTLEIAREYAGRDPRIRVVAAEEFVGTAQNANRALREMSPESKYCKVLHADDWMFPECLERMVGLSVRNPTVGVVSAYRLEETSVTLAGIPYHIDVLPGREVARSALLGGPYPYLYGSPSSVLIRSDLIRRHDPFYNVENRFQHDQEALHVLLQETDYGFVHQVLTFTRRPETAGTAYWVRVGAGLPGQIDLFLKYGPEYLDQPEYRRRLTVLIAEYARSLVTNARKLGDADYREHQLTFVRGLLRRIAWSDLPAGVLLQLGRMLAARRLRPGRG
jgi:glycosyltransferase involved in cell wall biosynthesis